jgi:hypothetical protein
MRQSIFVDDLIIDDDDESIEKHEGRELYRAALKWMKRGYNVVPQKAVDQKHPRVKWKDLQTRRVTKDGLLEWYSMFANGVGFITGAISNVIVIETDGSQGETVLDEFEFEHGPLPETLKIRSGSQRGFHRHFKHPGHRVKTKANPEIKIDVKGDGGFCVLPPSLHKSGGYYEIRHDAEPAELPPGLLEFIEAKAAAQRKPKGGKTRESRVCNGSSGLGEMPEHIRKLDGANIPAGKTDKPPPPAETMRDILQHLNARNCFAKRSGIEKDEAGCIVAVGWLECGMALKLAYADAGLDLWAITHVDERARDDAPEQWESFACEPYPGHVTIGTLIKAANDAGFVMPGSLDGEVLGTEGGNPHGDTSWDIKNGRLFADRFRDKLLFIHETGDVLAFDEVSGWVHAEPGEADRAAKEVVKILRDQAADEWKRDHENPKAKRLMKHVEYSSKDSNLRAMIRQATSEPGVTKRICEFDADPLLLGVRNGVLDLKGGALLSVSPKVLVSKRCNIAYDPSAACPQFLRYLEEVQPDAAVRAFLQRFAGYCLTGEVGEKKFLMLTGTGDNGKTVFVELLNWLLGGHARKIETELLMTHRRNPQGPSADIVALKGLRFVYANETRRRPAAG